MEHKASSFELLSRLAASFEAVSRNSEARRRAALQCARTLGGTAVPLCTRELKAQDEERLAWAFAVLIEIADAGNKDRVIAAMREIAHGDQTDEIKLRAVAVLAELGETRLEATLDDPQAVRRDSMTRLGKSLRTDAEVAHAASLLTSQLSPVEVVSFVAELLNLEPRGGLCLCAELALREDISNEVRAAVGQLIVDRRRPSLAKSRGKIHSLRAIHSDGHVLVVTWSRRPRSRLRRFRSAAALFSPSGALAEFRYGDDYTRGDITNRLVGAFASRGFVVGDCSIDEARELIESGLRRMTGGSPLPTEFYLGRDLFGLAPEDHQCWRPAGSQRTAVAFATSLAGYAHASGHDSRSSLYGRVLESAETAEELAELGRAALEYGELGHARGAFELALRLRPDDEELVWSLSAVANKQGCRGSCYLALLRFRALADPASERSECANQFIDEYERQSGLLHPDSSAIDVARADQDAFFARTALEDGDFTAAEAGFRRATERVPSHFGAWTGLAEIRSQQGELAGAEDCAHQALLAKPNHVPAARILAKVAAVEPVSSQSNSDSRAPQH